MKKLTLISVILFLGIVIFFQMNCSQEEVPFKDSRDEKIYKTITIGDQTIMAENLAYKPDIGNFWAYNNESSNIEKYGYLCDWKTAIESVPTGWHLPSKEE
jgi:uncharacterized protein (TIGR02145 family)